MASIGIIEIIIIGVLCVLTLLAAVGIVTFIIVKSKSKVE